MTGVVEEGGMEEEEVVEVAGRQSFPRLCDGDLLS